ncbi:MAG: dihydroxy-acid dehydratase [Deltaproteobacteria bacterium]|jgi:dihydroxy-acid dehydratase|nr:dihydroxy-acid dehydratase [Deltaproteobacteria bacterium]
MHKKNEDSGVNRNLTTYGDTEFSKYMRRAFLASAGYDRSDLQRPVVGIVDTSSDYNVCHRQMPEMITAVKRGVLEAGGLPLVFPTISLNEILTSPTTMLFRNLQAMETEEMIRAQPMDAVVLLGGCDKTVPAQVMGAVSANLPAVSVVAGSMLTGSWRGERLGACTDCRRFWAQYRGQELDQREIDEIEESLCFTGGTCMVMGTASTMACLVETLGLMIPGGAAPPHASGARLKNCVMSGRLAVTLAQNNVRPRDILSRASFSNAITVLSALSGSTNAIIHLLAIAGRAQIELTLKDFDAISQQVPVLVDCKPAGKAYMQDFYHAGGVPVLLKTLEPLLDTSAMTITGHTLADNLRDVAASADRQSTIRPLESPLAAAGALAVVQGSLAPQGAVIKTAAANPALLTHRGPAVVFESPADVANRIDDPGLGITPDHVMVLRNAGPVGAGMPEAGSMPIPKYLSAKGVTDMVRVSDARMSGTAYGSVVLHCSPEAAVGGPLALVQDGDFIELNVPERRLELLVAESELAIRKTNIKLKPAPPRGWLKLHAEHVLQAHLGADLDFL